MAPQALQEYLWFRLNVLQVAIYYDDDDDTMVLIHLLPIMRVQMV